ncbi:hypothetical protein Dimus_003955 [Dionaea muscipula]
MGNRGRQRKPAGSGRGVTERGPTPAQVLGARGADELSGLGDERRWLPKDKVIQDPKVVGATGGDGREAVFGKPVNVGREIAGLDADEQQMSVVGESKDGAGWIEVKGRNVVDGRVRAQVGRDNDIVSSKFSLLEI